MNPYHWIIKRKMRTLVRHINRGDLKFVTRQFSPEAEHIFSGKKHALSGTRRSPELIAAWYERLGRLFPDLTFKIKKMIVGGFPWNTEVVLEVDESSTDGHGHRFYNQVVLMIIIRWGRATRLSVYCDTETLVKNLNFLAEQGLADATLAPLEGP